MKQRLSLPFGALRATLEIQSENVIGDGRARFELIRALCLRAAEVAESPSGGSKQLHQ
jgi:hypothetical protein